MDVGRVAAFASDASVISLDKNVSCLKNVFSLSNSKLRNCMYRRLPPPHTHTFSQSHVITNC